MRVELKKVEDVKDGAGETGVHRSKVQLPDRIHLIGEYGRDRQDGHGHAKEDVGVRLVRIDVIGLNRRRMHSNQPIRQGSVNRMSDTMSHVINQ